MRKVVAFGLLAVSAIAAVACIFTTHLSSIVAASVALVALAVFGRAAKVLKKDESHGSTGMAVTVGMVIVAAGSGGIAIGTIAGLIIKRLGS